MCKAALRPNILFRKGVTTVPFNIADAVVEGIVLVVYHELTVDFMGHAVNTVSALHEWDESKGPHTVIADGRKGLKAEDAFHFKIVVLIIQRDSVLCKFAISKFGKERFVLILNCLKWYMKNGIIRYNLQ